MELKGPSHGFERKHETVKSIFQAIIKECLRLMLMTSLKKKKEVDKTVRDGTCPSGLSDGTDWGKRIIAPQSSGVICKMPKVHVRQSLHLVLGHPQTLIPTE